MAIENGEPLFEIECYDDQHFYDQNLLEWMNYFDLYTFKCRMTSISNFITSLVVKIIKQT